MTKISRATHILGLYSSSIKCINEEKIKILFSYVVRMHKDAVIDNAHFSPADSTRNVQTDTFQKLAIIDVRRGHYTQYCIVLCT